MRELRGHLSRRSRGEHRLACEDNRMTWEDNRIRKNWVWMRQAGTAETKNASVSYTDSRKE